MALDGAEASEWDVDGDKRERTWITNGWESVGGDGKLEFTDTQMTTEREGVRCSDIHPNYNVSFPYDIES